MFRVKIRNRIIFAFLSVIIIPLIITISFFFFYGKHLYKQDADSFILSYDTVSAIGDYVSGSWDLITDDYEHFDNGVMGIIGDKPIAIRIIDTSGTLVYDSSSTILEPFELYTQIVPGLEGYDVDPMRDFLSYTIGEYIYVDGEMVGIKLYTYPPPPRFISKLIILIVSTFFVGLLSLIIHICVSVCLISRRITKPLKELDKAIQKISQNNYDFDITYTANDELGALCHTFQTMKDKLKDYHEKEGAVMSAKKHLVASISHDLRTPMTSIKGYIEALQDGLASEPEKFNEYINIIESKVDSLNLLIDDLFDLSKLDLGQFNFNYQRLHVKTFAQNFYLDIKEEAGWQGKNIIKQFINIDFAIIHVDPARLEQALTNLVINAFKFSSREILFQCYTCNKNVYFSIIDDGPGIPEEDIPFIFDKFYKVEKCRTSNTGSGLGLSIARSIVTQMGGEIKAKNNSNTKGVVFTLIIPIME